MKVIAVFDIENDRIFDYSCDLHVWNEFGDVRLVKENVLLRPLPEEEESADEVVELGSYNEGYGNGYECGFADGWNACLKEITK